MGWKRCGLHFHSPSLHRSSLLSEGTECPQSLSQSVADHEGRSDRREKAQNAQKKAEGFEANLMREASSEEPPQSVAGTQRTPRLRKIFRAHPFGVRRVLTPLFGAGAGSPVTISASTRWENPGRARYKALRGRSALQSFAKLSGAALWSAARPHAAFRRRRWEPSDNQRFDAMGESGKGALQSAAGTERTPKLRKTFRARPLECGAASRRFSARARGGQRQSAL